MNQGEDGLGPLRKEFWAETREGESQGVHPGKCVPGRGKGQG